MKKPNFKNILKRFTIIDILIIICIIGAVGFALMHTGGSDDKSESVSFDSSTLNKFAENYLNFYQEGNIVKTHLGGYNASTGKYQQLSGTVLWVDDNHGADVRVLIDTDGDSNSKPILATLYKDVQNSDIYIEHITLETNGEKYNNVTEIQISPQNITTLDELTNKIENNTNYTISTKIAIDEKDSKTFQELSNELFLNTRKTSIRPISENIYEQIYLIMAGKEEINIASNILGTINGQTDIITIRIYNSTPEEINAIKNAFDVINVKKIT
ncbi:adhesin [Methanobrevibacter sp. TMH8]|uniref:adhesin n=1 Tax=Methanobrevibacter sp. TMH8 TaxID=2848611 RepID=UPI001CCF4FD9|nr:adhesin [Methanobrevibacter sp. TMH8]MBZ9570811.1 adhesin [Methanobrevibacter sp. TMH8]